MALGSHRQVLGFRGSVQTFSSVSGLQSGGKNEHTSKLAKLPSSSVPGGQDFFEVPGQAQLHISMPFDVVHAPLNPPGQALTAGSEHEHCLKPANDLTSFIFRGQDISLSFGQVQSQTSTPMEPDVTHIPEKPEGHVFKQSHFSKSAKVPFDSAPWGQDKPGSPGQVQSQVSTPDTVVLHVPLNPRGHVLIAGGRHAHASKLASVPPSTVLAGQDFSVPSGQVQLQTWSLTTAANVVQVPLKLDGHISLQLHPLKSLGSRSSVSHVNCPFPGHLHPEQVSSLAEICVQFFSRGRRQITGGGPHVQP